MNHRRTTCATALGLILAVAWAVSPPVPATAAEPSCAVGDPGSNPKVAVSKGQSALQAAVQDVGAGHPQRAAGELRVLRSRIGDAHAAATALIGDPPQDPESDEPPGPPAVLKVGALEHRVVTALVPVLSDPTGQRILAPLRRALTQAAACRDTMLTTVIDLGPAERDDYVDGLSDTLPTFKAELKAISGEADDSRLTADGRSILVRVKKIVAATSAAMKRVFGGGERAAAGSSR